MVVRATLVLLLLTALLSGCADSDSPDAMDDGSSDGSGDGSGNDSGSGSGSGDDGAGSSDDAAMDGNETVEGEEYTCTAAVGQGVGFSGGNVEGGVVSVSACTLTTAGGEVELVSEDMDSGCYGNVDTNGDGTTDPTDAPYEIGATYPSGSIFGVSCGAANAEGSGSIVLADA